MKDLNLPIPDQVHMHPYNQQREHDREHDRDHVHGHQEHHDEGGDGDGHCLLIRQSSSVYGQVLALHRFV